VKLINTLHEHFGKQNVNRIEKHEGVFLCEKKTDDGKIYQIIFVDTTNKWCEDNHLQYIESVVIDKYYQTGGFLQWNFYYYFITTKELLKANSLKKIEIEADETYSRKSVLTEEEFTDWVNSFDNISKISKDEISNDLYSNWVNYLREKKLFFVFNSDKYPNYKQPVEDYINGIPSDDIEEIESNETSNTSAEVLQKINELELVEFREYPLKRKFSLGYVNLIHGANAVGKTSFFDAIELIVTGKLFYKTSSDSCKVQLKDASNNILKFPTRPSPYKRRDIDWYSSGANRGNDLNGNFNKFNYYTSDAAFQLKQDDGKEEKNLETLIADIALGREVNKLEDRIKAFHEKFSASADSFLNESTRLNENLREKNEAIKELIKQQKNPQGYKDSLNESLKNNYWNNRINDSDDNFIAKLDNEIQTVLNILSKIQSKNLPLDKLSKESIIADLRDLKLKKLSISAIKDELLKIQQQRHSYLNDIERNKRLLPLTEELSLYFKHEQFGFLVGLEKNITEKTIELNKAKDIKELADSILSNEFFSKESEKTKTIKQIEDEIKLREESLNKNYDEIELKIKQIEEGIEDLAIIISDIKSSGQSYLKLNPKAEDCPLCNTHFSNEDLVEAIQRTQESFTNSIALISLKEELEFTSKRIDETGEQLKATNKLKQLAFSLFSTNSFDKTFVEIKSSSEANTKILTDLAESLIQLNTIQSQFNNAGITEDRFTNLLESINEQLSINIKSSSDLDLQRQTLLERQIQLSAASNQLEKEFNEKEIQSKMNFTSEITNEEQLLQSLNVLQEIESNFKQLEIYLVLPPNTLLVNILEKANEVQSFFETFRKASLEAKQQNQAIDITKKEVERIIAEVDLIKPKQIRAQFANTELNNILTKQSKNDYLSGYITKNKSEIVSIFKLIHTPREFKDINFDKKIILISNDGTERTLSEISTGQRSALALSIFLSLNKKLSKGPNILMFDDPVTYVDDMNVLSFFDYLRELVIKSKRQVFFATANDDLAFLFRKKFEFLEDELTTHKLERKNENE
jgi:exonuclease SbcC